MKVLTLDQIKTFLREKVELDDPEFNLASPYY